MPRLNGASGELFNAILAALQCVSAIVVYRIISIGISFGIGIPTVIAIRSGSIEGDTVPWLTFIVTMGCPTLVAWILQTGGWISREAELSVLKGVYWFLILMDSSYMAFSSAVLSTDLWLKACCSPTAYVGWGCSLRAMSKADTMPSSRLVLALGILTVAAVIRRYWDDNMSGMVWVAWCTSLVFQVGIVMLNDSHTRSMCSTEQLVVEQKVQVSLLSAAFDATMRIVRRSPAATAGSANSYGLFFEGSHSNSSFSKMVGHELHGKPLHVAISDGIDQLNELFLAAEEADWNPQKVAVMCRGLVTCYDNFGYEFDCEVRSVMQAPGLEQSAGGALLCGLRLSGEKRQSMNKSSILQVCSGKNEVSEETSSQVTESTAATTTKTATEKEPGKGSVGQAVWAFGQVLLGMFVNQDDAEGDSDEFQKRAGAAKFDPQMMAWESLNQIPEACAVWCKQGDLCILQSTRRAVSITGKLPGQHFVGALPQATHAVLLRKAIKLVQERYLSAKDSSGFFVRPPLSLLMQTSTGAVVETAVTLIFLPACPGKDPAVFILMQFHGGLPTGEMGPPSFHSLSALDTQSQTGMSIMPDDSASQIMPPSLRGRTPSECQWIDS